MAATEGPEPGGTPGVAPVRGGGKLTAQVVAITTVVQALVTMCTIISAVVAPELARALGVPASMIGLQVSIIYLGAMATSVVGGLLVRRLGALRTSQLSLVFGGIGVSLMVVPSLTVVALGALLVGFGYGLTNPSSAHLLMRVTRLENRNLIFSLKQTGVPLGGVAAGLAAPSLALAFGWQAPFLVGAGATLAFLAVIQPFRGDWDTDRDPGYPLRQNLTGDLGMVWRDGVLRKISLAAFCFSAVQVSLWTFAVIMLVEDVRFGLVEAGVVLSVMLVAGILGRLLWGFVADWLRDGNKVLLGVALISLVAGLLTVLLNPATPEAIIYAVLILFGLSAIGWNGVFMAEVARLAPENRIGNAIGGSLVPTFAGVLVGPATFSVVFGLTGQYTATFGIFALFSLTGFALVLSARRLMAGD